jgi:hypothetical protein
MFVLLRAGKLANALAGKLAGGLSWASQHIFHRIGRAMLLPLFWHSHGFVHNYNIKVLTALKFWREVLAMELKETKEWNARDKGVCQLLCDARGTPPHLAAILVIGGVIYYTHLAPPASVLQFFHKRDDAQIMGLELLAIALGLSTFGELVRDRTVHTWSDNAGAESSCVKGSAKQWDHACVVHSIWIKAAELKASLFIDRVSTADNLADLPSRESFSLLQRLGAKHIPAVLDDRFTDKDAWEACFMLSCYCKLRAFCMAGTY